jgi:hypothetical protein
VRWSPKHRFWRIFPLLVLLSVVIAAIAVVSGRSAAIRGCTSIWVIATALGTGLPVLIGSALMTLAFISNADGRDEARE